MTLHARHASMMEGQTHLTRPFLVWSVLGIAWSIMHIGMEWSMGIGNFRRWLVLLAAWSALLLLALLRTMRSWMGWGLIAMGAFGVFALPLRHFEWERSPVSWFGLLPRIATEEKAGPGWIVPYNLLIYIGLAIGVALLWSGARMMHGGASRPRQSLRLLLFVGILFFPGIIGGFLGRGQMRWGIAIEAALLGIMLATVWLTRRPAPGRIHPAIRHVDAALVRGQAESG